jgi:alpha-tubulin suppressor-like RCC1 family protein
MLGAVTLVISSAGLSSGLASSALARSRPHLVVKAPGTVFIISSVRVTGRAVTVPPAARAVLMAREQGRWRRVAQASLVGRPAGAFALTFRAPKRRGALAIRIEITKGSVVIVSSPSKRVQVEPRPLVIPVADVTSVPAPGGAGVVVLHARLPGAHAGSARAASSCPTLPGTPAVGQVTAVGYSPATPYGSLTKINLVSIQPPCKITLQTVPATLEELVANSGASINYASLRDVTTGKAASAGTSFTRPLGKAVTCSGGGSASLSGSLSFGITPSLHASFSLLGGLSSASFSVTGSATASLSANIHAATGCSLNNVQLVAPFDIATFEGSIGGWPIVVTLRGLVNANASLSAGARTTTGITAKESVTGGVGYGKPTGSCAGHAIGAFYPIYCGPTSNPFTFTPPTVTATANATATISPTLQALLYGAAGPQVSLTTGLDFNANTTKNPWWTLTAPFNSDGSLVAPILDLSTGSLTLHHSSFPVANAGGPFNGSPNVTGGIGAGGGVGPGVGTADAVAGGDEQACALLDAGTVACWGDNMYGELGDGTSTGPETCPGGSGDACSTVPVLVNGITTATQISRSANTAHCALLVSGGVDCWGDNSSGELGDGTATGPETCPFGDPCSTTPVSVSGIADATQIATGGLQSCALLADGTVECWGDNEYGELGIGTASGPDSCSGDPCATTPVAVSGISKATQIAAGGSETCALLVGGTVDCWGDNGEGELGDGTSTGPETCIQSEPCSTTPVEVNGITDATQISAGTEHACALLSDGGLDCWGDNIYGQLGDGTSTGPAACSNLFSNQDGCSTVPVPVSGITTAMETAADGNTSCAVLSAGMVDCWGENQTGELGTGSFSGPETCKFDACSTTPVQVSGIDDAAEVSPGEYLGCALLKGGAVACWGDDEFGALGNNGTTSSPVPVQVSPFP